MTRTTKIKPIFTTLRPFGLLFVAIALLGAGIVAVAQNSQNAPTSGLAISPPTFEINANLGDVLKNSVRVDNVTDETLDLTVSKRNFVALGEEGGVDLSEEESTYSLSSWITVAPENATIKPRESKTFEFTVKVPPNAEPGGRFGSIIFKTTARPVTGQTGVAIAQEVGALVFVKIAGEVKEQASVAGFGAQHGFNENGPVNFEVRVKNEGNVHFKPTGTISISNFFGQKVATIPIDAQNVLPDATRKMAASWDNFWLFGKYEATASIVYGNDQKIITATTTFWGFPYKLALVIALGATLLFLLIYPRRARLLRALKVLFGKE